MKLPGRYRMPHTGIYYFQPPMVKGVRPKPINLRTKDSAEAVEAYYQARKLASETFRRSTLWTEGVKTAAPGKSGCQKDHSFFPLLSLCFS
ncbi:MAG: hypothetical protein GXX91_12630 [Verrucomicrobiaceae bacterium]|nr:hypothetical protein [Verrucomicrobiaceae bacterium]